MSHQQQLPHPQDLMEMLAPRMPKNSVSLLAIPPQTQQNQRFDLDTGIDGVIALKIRLLKMLGVSTTGSWIGLTSNNFVAQQSLNRSVIGTANRPLTWIQPYPIPALSDQLKDTLFECKPQQLKDFTLQIVSDGVLTFAPGWSANWIIYCTTFQKSTF